MNLNIHKPSVLKVHPPISRITAHAQKPGGLEHSMISFFSMLKMQIGTLVCSEGGLNPRPISHALTTRPQPPAIVFSKFLGKTTSVKNISCNI